MTRPVRVMPITAAQRAALVRLVQRPTASQRAVRRAQIILHRADGVEPGRDGLAMGEIFSDRACREAHPNGRFREREL